MDIVTLVMCVLGKEGKLFEAVYLYWEKGLESSLYLGLNECTGGNILKAKGNAEVGHIADSSLQPHV